MDFLGISKNEGIATVTLNRGKVNALNEQMVEQLKACFEELEGDNTIRVIILTGRGRFFSFGFDIPEFLSYSKDSFVRYLTKFTDLYTYLFTFPKPVVAALNGHTIAGGCMLATACDYRIMASGKAKISLNEIGFGSSVFAGSVEILKFCAGERNAQSILYSGAMYSAEQAKELGLVDQVSSEDSIIKDTETIAGDFAAKDASAFSSIKALLRKPAAEKMKEREKTSIREFIEIWYSDATWRKLQEIKIHS